MLGSFRLVMSSDRIWKKLINLGRYHQNHYDQVFKVLVIGNSGAGKSSIIQRYADKVYSDGQPTIGVDLRSPVICLNDRAKKADGMDTRVKLQLWDTAGQERYSSIIRTYYRTAHAAIVVFDVNDLVSWQRVGKWIEEVRDSCNNVPYIVLVGNKADKTNYCRAVSRETAEIYARDSKLHYIETSARENSNIDELFQWVAQCLHDRYDGIAPNHKAIILSVSQPIAEDAAASSGRC
jgi:small GTP-binding protein